MNIFAKIRNLPFAVRLCAVFGVGLLLCGLMLGIFNHYVQSSYLQTLSVQNQDFAAQVDTTGFYTESFLRNMANQIFYSRSVEKLRTYASLTGTQRVEGERELNSFSAASLIVDSIYVYNGKQNYIYSTESYGAVSDSVDAFLDQTAAELFLNRVDTQRLELFPRQSFDSKAYSERRIFSYMYFEVDQQGEPADNAIMFNLNESWISELLFSNYSGDNSFILDSDGQIVISQDGIDSVWLDELYPIVTEMRQAGESGGYFIEVLSTGQKVVCFYAEMGQHDWCYVRPMDYAKCLGVLLHLGRSTFIIAVIGFLVLIVAGIVATVQSYVPLRRVANRLASVSLDSGTELDTERIMSNLNRLIKESSDSAALRLALGKIIRSQLLCDLLFGRRNFRDVIKELADCELKIALEHPLTLCIVSGLRVNLYCEAIGAVSPCEAVEINGQFSCLLIQTDSPDQLLPILNRLHADHLSTYFFLSSAFSDWAQTPIVYERLSERYKLRFLQPELHVRYWAELPELTSAGTELQMLENHIIGFLRKGFYNKAVECWREFRTALDGKSFASVSFALMSLSGAVAQLSGQSDGENSLPNLTEGTTDIEGIETNFLKQFRLITTKVQGEHNASCRNLVQDIMSACQEQAFDPQLSSQSLAKQFGLSVAYLCRIFRQANNLSVQDYINCLRIERAKQLLSQSNILIKDIPARVGIENQQYFFKLFKQVTGKTPKQYQSDSKADYPQCREDKIYE